MTPLERAARAIHDNLPLDSGTDPPDVEMLIGVARAVLTAIREPSEGAWHLVEHRDGWTIQDQAGGGGKPLAQSYAGSSVEQGRQLVRAANLTAMIDAVLTKDAFRLGA